MNQIIIIGDIVPCLGDNAAVFFVVGYINMGCVYINHSFRIIVLLCYTNNKAKMTKQTPKLAIEPFPVADPLAPCYDDHATQEVAIMAKKIISRESFFGATVHYDEHGNRIGTSYPGLFGGTNHYDAKGHKVGYSMPRGSLNDEVHYDNHGHKVGYTFKTESGYDIHYDSHGHKIGTSRDSLLFGRTTTFKDKK